MASAVVLVHSPLVGPGTWRNLAAALDSLRLQVIVPDLRCAMQAEPPLYPRLIETVLAEMAGLDANGDLVLVGHSGAGALLPSIVAAESRIRIAIFMDAVLPHPGQCWFDTAPAGLSGHIRSLVCDGHLPRWDKWWPPGSVRALLKDEDLGAAFEAELGPLPLAYFEERAPDTEMPDSARCAYLQLSPACRIEADHAMHNGWAVARLDLHHLAMLTHADIVAGSLAELAGKVQRA